MSVCGSYLSSSCLVDCHFQYSLCLCLCLVVVCVSVSGSHLLGVTLGQLPLYLCLTVVCVWQSYGCLYLAVSICLSSSHQCASVWVSVSGCCICVCVWQSSAGCSCLVLVCVSVSSNHLGSPCVCSHLGVCA